MIITCPKCGAIFDTEENRCSCCDYRMPENAAQAAREVETKKKAQQKLLNRVKLSTWLLLAALFLVPMFSPLVGDVRADVPVKTEPIVFAEYSKYKQIDTRCKFEADCDKVVELISVVTTKGNTYGSTYIESSQGQSTYYYRINDNRTDTPILMVVGESDSKEFLRLCETNDSYTFYGTRESTPTDIHPSGYGSFLYDPNDPDTILEKEFIDSCVSTMKSHGVMKVDLDPEKELTLYEERYTTAGIIFIVVWVACIIGAIAFKIKARYDLKKSLKANTEENKSI